MLRRAVLRETNLMICEVCMQNSKVHGNLAAGSKISLGVMMTTATSILMINTNVTIIMQLWHLARAGSVSNTGLGSCCKHDFKQFFSNMISFENFWTVTPVSYCHCHWSKHGLIIIVVPDWYWDFLDHQCLTIRAHNLCHDNRQLIVIAINRNHSAKKINCN